MTLENPISSVEKDLEKESDLNDEDIETTKVDTNVVSTKATTSISSTVEGS
jgi:hypothetical protein